MLLRHDEAKRFAATVEELPVRAALRMVNSLMLEADGILPPHWLKERVTPTAPLDLLLFSRLVAELFANCRHTPALPVRLRVRHGHLTNLDEALRFVESLRSEVARRALGRFLQLADSAGVDGGGTIDVLYCCRLLAMSCSGAC